MMKFLNKIRVIKRYVAAYQIKKQNQIRKEFLKKNIILRITIFKNLSKIKSWRESDLFILSIDINKEYIFLKIFLN